MYTPRHFENKDHAEIVRFVQDNSFATVITPGDKLLATHIPLEINEQGTFLTGHISAANPQTHFFTGSPEVLCVFLGPDAYISSSWYDHQNVPTWNYIAVHIYGRVNILTGSEARAALTEMMNRYESRSVRPVAMEDFSENYLEKSLRSITAFRIDITSLSASYKLSQNRDLANHERIVTYLEERGTGNDMAIANEMKKRKPKA